MEREKSVGQFLVERSFLPLGFFLVPFAPKVFLVSSRVVCVFFASSMFLLESLRVASKRTLGDQQFLIRIEKSASNAEKL